LEIDSINGIVIIVGNYGSGKTEVSVNLAIHRRKSGAAVRVADLDLVNPYFRTREVKDLLRGFGIDVVLPSEQYLHADLPILSPAVSGILRSSEQLTILDVGGDDAGATVLSSLRDVLAEKKLETFQVVNPFRPFTGNLEGCLRIKREIEAASRLPITGFIGNANLIDDTEASHIYEGHDFMVSLSRHSGLPTRFITVPEHVWPFMDTARLTCPVLSIKRQLVPPWKKAVRISAGG